jgi:hypothetical protein
MGFLCPWRKTVNGRTRAYRAESFAGGGQGTGMLPAPTAIQAVNPAPALGSAKIRSRPNLAGDGSAQAPEKFAAETAMTETADHFLIDAPFLTSFRIAHPNANPRLAPDASLSNASTPAAATDQAKAALASFRPQRETSQPSTPAATAQANAALASFRPRQRETSQAPSGVSVSPPASMAAAGANTTSVAPGAAARAKATYGGEAAYTSGSKGFGPGPSVKHLPPGGVKDPAAGADSVCLPRSSPCSLLMSVALPCTDSLRLLFA